MKVEVYARSRGMTKGEFLASPLFHKLLADGLIVCNGEDIWPNKKSSPRQRAVLTLSEVAAELHCSLATVKRRVHSGALPVVRDGRIVRIRAVDLERFLLERVQRGGKVAAATVPRGLGVTAGARLWD
jgi:excisionase family DNA binding protein